MITGIIDVSRNEANGDLTKASTQGDIVAVLAKATEGKDFVDSSFIGFMNRCRVLKLLRCAYHYGSDTESGTLQADWFLAHCQWDSDPDLRLALDFEPDTDGVPTMTRANAKLFVQRVKDVTGRWPMIYGSSSFLRDKFPVFDAVMAQCALWIAQFGELPIHLAPSWKSWLLWQYTDGVYGPKDQALYTRKTVGFEKFNTDRNAFAGTVEELRAVWSTLGLPQTA